MHLGVLEDTPPDVDVSFQGVSHLGAKGQFVLTRIPNSIQVTFAWTSATDVGPLPDFIIEYIVQYFPRYCMVDLDRFVLPFYTEYRRHGHTFRAHPNYRAGQRPPWYDWAMFRWCKEQCAVRRNRYTYAVDVVYMDGEVNEDLYDYMLQPKFWDLLRLGMHCPVSCGPATLPIQNLECFRPNGHLPFGTGLARMP
jgi:hypothetical protein